MKTLAALLFLVCVCYSSGFFTNKPAWRWHDCSDPSTRVLKMIMFDISPKPLKIPGDATVTLIGILAHTLPVNSHYRLNVTMDKQLLGNWHHVPCRNNVGTCLYDDPCEWLQQFAKNHSCPKALTEHGISCTCPINAVSLNFPSFTIHIKSFPPAWLFLVVGDFKARVEVLSGQTMIGCFEVELSIEIPCTGFLCGGR